MLCLLGIQHVQTTAYHPEGNGLVERFHHRLKDALRALCTGLDWFNHLPWVVLGLRAAACEDNTSLPLRLFLVPLCVCPDNCSLNLSLI